MIKAVIFDLDDTLYNEEGFIRGGFRAVAQELASRGIGTEDEIATYLVKSHFTEGRDGVLNRACEKLSFPKAWLPDLVAAFRTHTPEITLAPEAPEALASLKEHYLLGCVTDGLTEVQVRKINALGLTSILDCIVLADRYGRKFWKPHPLPIRECCYRLGVGRDQAILVGDNPATDMRGAINAGLRSVRIHRDGAYFSSAPEEPGEKTDFHIRSLAELEQVLVEIKHSDVVSRYRVSPERLAA